MSNLGPFETSEKPPRQESKSLENPGLLLMESKCWIDGSMGTLTLEFQGIGDQSVFSYSIPLLSSVTQRSTSENQWRLEAIPESMIYELFTRTLKTQSKILSDFLQAKHFEPTS